MNGAVFADAAAADGDDFAFLRLLLCGFRNDDAAGALGVLIDATYKNADVQRPKVHGHICPPWV